MSPYPEFEAMGAVLVDLMDQITCLRNEIKLIKNTAANEKILMDDTAMIKDDLNFIKDRIKSFQPQIDELCVNQLHKEKDISLDSEKSISPLEIEKFEQFLDNYDLGNKKTFDPSAPSLSQLTQGDSYATVSARPPVLRPSSHLKANETTKPEKTLIKINNLMDLLRYASDGGIRVSLVLKKTTLQPILRVPIVN